jgi:UDP:flavonoid glycosyltransferase YjiC (YdhE family)
MRILLASTRSAGHLGPLVPFTHACERAGHEVLVAAPHSLGPHVQRAGLRHAALDDPSPEAIEPIMARARAASPDQANLIVMREVFAGEHARSALPGMLETMRSWRPDLVLRETGEFASVAAAERLGINHAHVAILLAAGALLDGKALAEPLDRLRAEAGLPPDPHPERLWDEPRLTMAPRSLEDPSAPSPLGTRRFREPARPARPLRDWWRGAGEPLVYVSFGSVAPGSGFFPGLYRSAIDALAELPIRVLMTVGTEVDPSELGPLPERVHVEPWVPQEQVMPHAAAMVGHGESGSTLAAMVAGVPLAVVPLFADQPHNARRVAALGAGVALGMDAVAAAFGSDGLDRSAGMAGAVRALLSQPGYRAAAGAVAAEIAALPPVDAAVPVLSELAGAGELAA